MHLKENITNNNKNVVLYLKLPYQITDKFSNMYLNVKNLYKTLIPKNNLNLVNNITVGMNSNVIKNIDEQGTYVGNPLKKIN